MTQKYVRIILGVLIVIAAPIAWWYAKNNPVNLGSLKHSSDQILSAEYEVEDVGARSFGVLTGLTTAGGRGAGGDSMKNTASLAMGVGSAGIATGMGGGGVAMAPAPDSKIVPPFAPENYEFKYVGEDLPDLENNQAVYKRVYENQSNNTVNKVIRTLSLGLIDLTRFDSTKLQQFSMVEDKSFGYGISVDVEQGNLNIYQNYLQWPQPYADCKNEACYKSNMLKIKDFPEDQALIEIADKFVQDKHVSMSGYGAPVVNNNWRELYAATSDKANFYFPEVADVVYPLMIDGQEAYDEGGNLSGLHVSVDVRNDRAAGLYDLTTKKYQKSNYTGVTDPRRIITVAEKGGFRSYSDPGIKTAKTITLKLDTPSRQILRMWKYDGNKSEEVFVPAYVFPIQNPGNFYRKNIVVPLVKEILDNEGNQPPVTIMERSSGGAAVDLKFPQ